MRCPTCGCPVVPWPWQDGGYKGVECSGACGGKWWSESFADAAYEVEKKAVRDLLETMSFPSDAKTDEQAQRDAEDLIRKSQEDR